jgi:hypothetical protein
MPREAYDGELHVDSSYNGDPNLAGTSLFDDAPIGSWFVNQSTGETWVKIRTGAAWRQAGLFGVGSLSNLVCCGPFEGYASGAYREVLPSGSAFPTSVTWYTATDRRFKIYDLTLTRSSSQMITQAQWRLYAADGATVTFTATDTITYDGPFESSRDRALA